MKEDYNLELSLLEVFLGFYRFLLRPKNLGMKLKLSRVVGL